MNSSDGMLIVNVSAIQAVAIAAATYYFGAWLRKKVPYFDRDFQKNLPGRIRVFFRAGGQFLPGLWYNVKW